MRRQFHFYFVLVALYILTMSIHAYKVKLLIKLPGDPLREFIKRGDFLEDAVCFNEVRNMLGYTGTYRSPCICH